MNPTATKMLYMSARKKTKKTLQNQYVGDNKLQMGFEKLPLCVGMDRDRRESVYS